MLRPPSRADADEFLALVATSRDLHGEWVAPPADPAAFERWLTRVAEPTVDASLAVREDTGEIAGALTISQIFYGAFCSAYLGFYAFAPAAGKGFMTAAIRAVVDRAFGPLALHRLEANVQPGNARSRALVERCGFRLEGFSPRYLYIAGAWRDHERWAITVEDVDPGRAAAEPPTGRAGHVRSGGTAPLGGHTSLTGPSQA